MFHVLFEASMKETANLQAFDSCLDKKKTPTLITTNFFLDTGSHNTLFFDPAIKPI